MSTVFFSDSCSDLPVSYCRQYNLRILPLHFKIDEKEYADDFGQSLPYHDFYENLRRGHMSTTSQVTAYAFAEAFRPVLEQGDDVFYIAFSSALSGTCQGAMVARDQLASQFPERKIFVFDSKAASLGLGLMVHYALRMRDEGKSPEDIYAWLEENHLKFAHWFTVGDLHHLRRGGRVSATAAFLGTMLNIKPVLHVDNNGSLIAMEKVKGRARSLRTLVDHMEATAINPASQTVFISHGDCIDDAELVATMIRERFGTKDILINYVGPVIGSHSGPDTMALFFLAKER